MKTVPKTCKFGQKGVTLIELMIALAMFSMLVSVIYSAYKSQLSSHITQRRVVDMQQNIRGALAIMEQDIRLAGWPSDGTADTGVISAGPNAITVAMDLRSCNTCPEGEPDGDVDDAQETVQYYLSNAPTNLMRRAGAQVPQILATNIDAIAFIYYDADGNSLGSNVSGGDLNNIKTVQVTLIAKDGQNEAVLTRKHTDDRVYMVDGATILDKSGTSDQLRRIMLTSMIVCQNL